MASDTNEILRLAEKIMIFSRREAAKKFTYLERAIYCLSLKASDKTDFMGADYSVLYYNPNDVIENYRKNPVRVEKAIVHCVLHCMLLHPSFENDNNKTFNYISDAVVNSMLENANVYENSQIYTATLKKYNAGTTRKLLSAALSNNSLYKKLSALWIKNKTDDHSVWHKTSGEVSVLINKAKMSAGDNVNGRLQSEIGSDYKKMREQEAVWQDMFESASSECSMLYGNSSGNIFKEIEPPDRFSRFSYKEYIKRFAVEEIPEDDPETFDMILYTAGLEMYEDMPIVELNEIRETFNPSDIVIAIDMSGSCSGDIATNFLRQVYTLFEEMNIRSSVNIHVVFFDTEILSEKIIRSREDAEKFVEEYKAIGFGGTSFNCVFDYADKFMEMSCGKKLKGLFFFSDAFGEFPNHKREYKTTFFVPGGNCSEYLPYDFVPEWIELVHYNDD